MALRYAARLNGLSSLVITKLDVLSGIGPISVCTRYRGGDEAIFDHYPYHQTVMHNATGEYEQLPGWDEDITACRDERELPQAARDYLDWKPTRSPEVEAQNEIDDVEQMIRAQNELKRRRGAPEITEEEIEARVREDNDEMRRWRGS